MHIQWKLDQSDQRRNIIVFGLNPAHPYIGVQGSKVDKASTKAAVNMMRANRWKPVMEQKAQGSMLV